MFSIDQNCHSLWDVLPKLQALAGRGYPVTHFVEDIDVAFTALGSGLDSGQLRLARERFHRSGGADWGAALFYSEFLGKLPVEIRQWEPFTGLKTNVLARQLGRSVDELFDEFSPGDNWQLIGSSYVRDRHHHRLVGDLSVAETAEFLRQIMAKARANTLETFPEQDSRRRVQEWFAREEQLLEDLLAEHADAPLAALYAGWLRRHLDTSVRLDATSNLFACGASCEQTRLLEVFLRDYDLASDLYNRSVEETDSGLRPLKRKEGELPFFAVLVRDGRWVRTGVFLDGEELRLSDGAFKLAAGRRIPVDALKGAGVRCLAGKAILLTIQARLGPDAQPLALPYRGSGYMAASDRLAEKLCAHGLLPGRLHPIARVRFGLLERMKSLDTIVRLPEHLVPYFNGQEVPAREIGDNYARLAAEAGRRLEALKDPARRRQWQQETFPQLAASIEELNRQRRQLARTDPAPEQIRALWKQVKALQTELLANSLRQIARDYQLREIDYWDSRGALLPWSIALGGERFYNELIAEAEIYEEPLPEACRRQQNQSHPSLL